MIKEKNVKGLLRKDNDLSWQKENILFLYGQNGIGKTTLLDLLYYALTNDDSIFVEYLANRSDEKRRALPCESLEIIFSSDDKNDNKRILVVGNVYEKTIKEKMEHVHKYKDQIEDIERFFKNVQRIFIKDNELVEDKKNEKTIDKYIDFLDKKKQNNIWEEKSEEERKKEREIDELVEELDLMYSNIINKKNEQQRKKFQDDYDVLYLTIERTIPEIIDEYKDSILFKKTIDEKLLKKLIN